MSSDSVDWKPDEAQISTPYLTVANAVEMIKFYEKAFGFKKEEAFEGKGTFIHVGMSYHGKSVVMFHDEKSPMNNGGLQSPKTSGQQNPIGLMLYTPDVDALLKQAVAAGATKIMDPMDMFWGDRMACVTDPSGYMWNMVTKVGEMDESKRPKFD